MSIILSSGTLNKDHHQKKVLFYDRLLCSLHQSNFSAKRNFFSFSFTATNKAEIFLFCREAFLACFRDVARIKKMWWDDFRVTNKFPEHIRFWHENALSQSQLFKVDFHANVVQV